MMQRNIRGTFLSALEHAEDHAEVRRQFLHRNDAFDLPNRHFEKMFRLRKEMAEELINLVAEKSEVQRRSSALDPTIKVLTTLRFLASGSYQLDIGQNINMAISQPSVSRCIRDVTNILNEPEIFNKYVHFPKNMQQLNTIRNRFYASHQFPGVIGCVDCTHVAIVGPPANDSVYPEHIYVNRKGYHSINVQLICDSNLNIINVNARYPGSTHDSYIWNNSAVLPLIRNLNRQGLNNYCLLGDSGYALRPWMLTPLESPQPGTPEAAYNDCLTSTRSIIERCNGVLKTRFRCLLKHRVLHYLPPVASKIINTCVVLHNMCIQSNMPDVFLEPEGESLDFGMYDPEVNEIYIADGAHRVNPDLAQARILQQRIIRNFF